MIQETDYRSLPELKFGHATNENVATGCTVIIAPQGAVAGADVRGGGPATRETDLLRPENMIERIHAVVLSGGSAYGLAAADGVMAALEKRDVGFDVGGIRVPIVCGASLFDLQLGSNVRPDKEMGYAAAQKAFSDEDFVEGNYGAGTGACVGKLFGPSNAMKAGFGMQFLSLGNLIVGACVVVNALGNVCDREGNWIAGCTNEQGLVMDGSEAFLHAAQIMMSEGEATTDKKVSPGTNTTLGVVVTNAALTKAEATKVSSSVHDAYARAIKPVHTSHDGDCIFTLASGKEATSMDVVAALANEAMQSAIIRAVTQAKSAYGLIAIDG